MTRESHEEYLDRKARQDAENRRRGAALGRRPTAPAPALRDLLAFEESHPGPITGSKATAFYDTFPGMLPPRYWQLINQAINDPRSLELNPTLVYRLREQRQARTTARNARTFPTR